MRRVFRTHRARSGASGFVRTAAAQNYGHRVAAAGIDLLVLAELMGQRLA